MNKKTTLLCVDDEPMNLDLFEINFGAKYDVITAESGSEGLDKLKVTPEIKIVLTDMKMPGMNGIEFIKIAKSEFPNVIFYILTGYSITEEISDALNDKLIEKYFSKPYNMGDLEAVIDEALK
jgi:two-component system, response regulator, stage 0 sporulation protein F